MPITGHPPADLLSRYAASSLALAPALVVESHLEACATCRQALQPLDAAHGARLAALPDAPLSSGALARALSRLDDPEPPLRTLVGDVTLSAALARHGLHSRRFVGPDFWVAPVCGARHDNWRAYVLRAPAGVRIPPHSHQGAEYFQVLLGAVSDGGAHHLGDFAVGPSSGDHALQVSADGPCACLIAVENGARWRGLTRLLSPWLGV